MPRFTDNMTGWQKLIGMFGLIILALLALRFIPTETGTLMTWIGDQIKTVVQMMGGSE